MTASPTNPVIALFILVLTLALAFRARRRSWVRSLVILGLGLRVLASSPGVMFLGSLAALAMINRRLTAETVKAIQCVSWPTHLAVPALLCWTAALVLGILGLGFRAPRGSLPLRKRLTGVALSGAVLAGLWRLDRQLETVCVDALVDVYKGVSPFEFRAATVPTVVSGLKAVRARQVALGDSTEARYWGGDLWGLAVDAQGGAWRFQPMATAERLAAPMALPLPLSISPVNQSEREVCALSVDGRGMCWRDMLPWTVFFPFTEDQRLVAIDTNICHTLRYCAVLSDGRGRCVRPDDWGRFEATDDFGENLIALTARFGCLGCAAIRDGGVDCWILRNDHSRIKTPVLGAAGIVFLTSSEEQACAIQEGGRLICWGLGRTAQVNLDLAQLSQSLRARPVLEGKYVKHVAVSVDHSCAVADPGNVFCWGENDWGQLGDGSTQARVDALPWEGAPVQVKGIEDAVSVAVAGLTTCAVHATGAVSCWGKRQRFGGG